MRFIPHVVSVFLMLILCLANRVEAQTPLVASVTYQGRVQDGNGPLNGTVDLTFRLYDSQTNGVAVSTIYQFPGWPVSDGLFTVGIPFGGNVFNGDERWVQVTVNGITQSPRQRIAPAPYALQTRGMFYNETQDFVGIGRETRMSPAEVFGLYRPGAGFGGMYVQGDADGLPFYGYSAGGSVDAYTYYRKSTNQWTLNVGGDKVWVDGIGHVGIGTPSPGYPLEVHGNDAITIGALNTAASGAGVASYGEGASGVAVLGVANGSGSTGIRGVANGANANAGEFQGDVIVNNGRLGVGTTDPFYKLDVREDTNGFAAYIRNSAFFQVALAGVSEDNGQGVYGQSTGSSGIAIKANAFNGALAGEFNGDVDLNGFVHVSDSVNSTATPTNHTMLIENTSTGTSPDVLSLKINSSDLTPSSAINYITFFNDADASLGAIQGDNLGGVEFAGPGNDYAEWLQHRDADTTFHAGDVVGVFGGRISHDTDGADQIMVVSTQPIVVGNRPQEDDDGIDGWDKVAFIGQAPVKVIGSANEGDFLIPSGRHDGTAIAIAPKDITPAQLAQVIGTAWDSTASAGESVINAAIGIDQSAASARVIAALYENQRRQQTELEALRAEMLAIKAMLTERSNADAGE